MNEPSLLLRRSLVANAVFSGLSGVLLLVLAGSLGGWFELPPVALTATAIALIGFSGGVFALSRSRRLHPGWTRFVIACDLCWVAGSAILLAGWPLEISSAGLVSVAGVAAIVLLFADLQWLGLRKSRAPSAATRA